jgi:SAM-dependent methyltransferase
MADSKRLQSLGRAANGARTVLRRRGFKYFVYLTVGVGWPRLLYRSLWGPKAPSVARRVFALTDTFAAAQPAAAELRAAQLVLEPSESPRPGRPQPKDIEQAMERAHAAGITGVRHAFDRAVLTDTSCKFLDLPSARAYRGRGAHFLAARDADRRAFNQRFGASLLTEAHARELLRSLKSRVPEGYRDYAPIDFGAGLTIGRVVSTDSGTGRWDFFNRHIVGPLVAGRRVVDLGANNASMSLMMARAGAREVVAVEATPAIAEFARLNTRIFSWRELRRYNVDVRTADMRVFLDETFGTFDVVTAFCSLYYLPEEDMARVIRRAARMGATLILQANEAIHNLPARATELARLMKQNGYPDVQITAPTGFSRPLLVGLAPVAVSERHAAAV